MRFRKEHHFESKYTQPLLCVYVFMVEEQSMTELVGFTNSGKKKSLR